MKPILIDNTVAQSTFKVRLPNNIKVGDIEIEIARVGDREGFVVVYPALSLEEQKVTFAWDYVLHEAKSGRYQGRILAKGRCVACVAFHIGCPCTMEENINAYFTHGDCIGCGDGKK